MEENEKLKETRKKKYEKMENNKEKGREDKTTK